METRYTPLQVTIEEREYLKRLIHDGRIPTKFGLMIFAVAEGLGPEQQDTGEQDRDEQVVCSFCGTPRDTQLGRLHPVVGSGALICLECISVCTEVLRSKRWLRYKEIKAMEQSTQHSASGMDLGSPPISQDLRAAINALTQLDDSTAQSGSWGQKGEATLDMPVCHCLHLQYYVERIPELKWSELTLHLERQDTNCDAWKRLVDLVEQAAEDGREEFDPGRELSREDWTKIITLPRAIAKLKSVKDLSIAGSNLVRLPPEIGEMSALEIFTPYTSQKLHWFPYELTRCRNLKRSTVSTRALYGNYKYRPPFPRLPSLTEEIIPRGCSVCNGPFGEFGPLQYWISLRVATDTLPLLVHACSEVCVRGLPDTNFSRDDRPQGLSSQGSSPHHSYIAGPHQGGRELMQPLRNK
jgi:hypothetical protein